MVPMYKKGGKKPKSSWMKESSEIKFGNGGADKPPFRWKTREERQTNKLNKNTKKISELEEIKKSMMMDEKAEQEIVPGIKGNSEMQLLEDQLNKLKKRNTKLNKTLDKTIQNNPEPKTRIAKKGGFDLNNDGKTTFADVLEGRLKGKNKKKTGGKSMEPGGGGRFAAMVSNLKKKGKSEDSAKKIAAAIGRKKYGKSKFQEMAAKGKKGLGGMSDSTGANEAGMGMMAAMDPGDGAKHAARIRRRQRRRTATAVKNRGKCNRGEICFD